MYKYTLTELNEALNQKEFSSVELVKSFLDRIKQYDPQINGFITVTEEIALAQAKHADEQRAQGHDSLLLGLPIAHKDIFCTQGVKTSCASKMLDNFIAPYESTVTQRMSEAGAVMLGKANMDEFAMGSSNETSYYGPVKNPWDLTRTPGGSSGGSAAIVAARLAPAATGTDTGGSVRQPAALCGITSIKPTYGRVSRWGMIAFASSFDQAGLMTQSVADSALLLQAIAGHDSKDSTSVDRPVDDYQRALLQPIKGLTLGLPREFFNGQLDPTIGNAIQAQIDLLTQLGVTFKEISLPNHSYAMPTYYILASAECSSNLSRFDGVRYGYRCKAPSNLKELYTRSRSEGFGDEVKRRILTGTHVLSSSYYDAYYCKAQKVRRLIQQDYLAAFAEVDAILTPTTPHTAFKLGDKMDKPTDMYNSDEFTLATNLAGLPGLNVPVGFDSAGLPIGAQFIGKHFDESTLFALGHHYQNHSTWHRHMPDSFNDKQGN